MNKLKLISLGMQLINGSMRIEHAVMMSAEKMSEFGLNLKEHIVRMLTDGAAIVELTSRSSEVLDQICHFHGIHWAAVAVLYKKNSAGEHEDESFDRETIHESTANKD